MIEQDYRCSNCLEQTVTRTFDVSHLSVTCEHCGEFARFVNGTVYDKFREFEESPPEHLAWDQLSRAEKFLVSNGVVREGRSIDDFETGE